jgi:hypothetical protein
LPDNFVGDMGGDRAQPLSHRRLEERAIRERWPLSDAVRIQILKRLVGYLDPETEEGAAAGARVVVAAARTILSADKLNLEQRRLDLAEQKMATEADELPHQGIDPAAAERALKALNGGDDGRDEPNSGAAQGPPGVEPA